MLTFSPSKEADFAMGAITQTPIRERVVDFSYPYFFTSIGIMSKKPSPLSKLMAIVWPYNKNVWLSLIVAIVVFILMHCILSKIEKASSRPKLSFGKSVQEISQMLLMQGTIA